jgi:hypothetical protein
MTDGKQIKSWEDWAVLTWRDIGKLQDELKEARCENMKLREDLHGLKDEHIKLKAQIYTVAAVMVIIFGIIEISINILNK